MLSHHAMEYSDDEKKSTEFTITELAKNEVIFQTIVLIIFFQIQITVQKLKGSTSYGEKFISS